MNILAIDPGLSTGWALLKEERIECGEWRLHAAREHSAGDAYAYLVQLIDSKIWNKENQIDLVVVEAPTPRSMKSAKLQFGMLAAVELAATNKDIAYLEFMPSEVSAFSKRVVAEKFDEVDIQRVTREARDIPKSKQASWIFYRLVHTEASPSDNISDAFALLHLGIHTQEDDE